MPRCDRSIAAGESPQTVIAALQRHFLRLHRMRSALDAGRSMEDVVRSLRPPLHFKQREAIEQQCRGWTLPQLGAALARIADAAKAARLNSALEGTLAEKLLLDIGIGRRKPSQSHAGGIEMRLPVRARTYIDPARRSAMTRRRRPRSPLLRDRGERACRSTTSSASAMPSSTSSAACDEAFLARHGCAKGSMQLVDAAAVAKLYDDMGPAVEISGGSGANTIVGVASFGGKAGFIGKTADDQFGQVFGHDIRTAGVTFKTPPAAKGSEPTGRCLVLVTPDGQRTMNTFLGRKPTARRRRGRRRARCLSPHRLPRRATCSTGRKPRPHSGRPPAIAAKAGRQVALSLSDAFCVDRHRAEFLELIRTSVDILFANEAEITSLYQTNSFDEAARRAGADTKLAALTRSEKGSVICQRRQVDRRTRSAGCRGGRHHGCRRSLCGGLPLRHRHRP